MSKKGRGVLLAVGLGTLVAGSLLGAGIVAWWSSRASGQYLQMMRLSFATEQEMRLRQAWQAGDLTSALRHAACKVEVDKKSRAFDPEWSVWHFWYPLLGVVANERTPWNPAHGTNVEAIAHAQLAVVLERLGRAEDASREFADAKLIGGGADIAIWRQVGISELDRPPVPAAK